jgi:hypothetical protein
LTKLTKGAKLKLPKPIQNELISNRKRFHHESKPANGATGVPFVFNEISEIGSSIFQRQGLKQLFFFAMIPNFLGFPIIMVGISSS